MSMYKKWYPGSFSFIFRCQCTEAERRDESLCRVAGTLGSVCNERGDCVCGECMCDPIKKNEDTGLITYIHGMCQINK